MSRLRNTNSEYLRRYRRNRKDVANMARASSSENDLPNSTDIIEHSNNEIAASVSYEDCYSESFSESASSDSERSEISDSDYGYTDTVESSESEYYESEIEENEAVEEKTLREQIASWSTKNRLTKGSIDELLGILRAKGHEELPKDARTLLQTPKKVDTELKCGGQYIYFGIRSGLEKFLGSQYTLLKHGCTLSLNFNIDGVPVFKSSGAQFWPILCSVENFAPFIVALFYGSAKPNSLDDYLSDFLNEIGEIKENPIIYNNKHYSVVVQAFICDAPARAFLKNMKGHTGYFSCERCNIEGYWKDNRVVFLPNDVCTLRTDDEFASRSYIPHQCGNTPLIDHGVSCVSGFSLDYMHLVCLGVVKRMLWFLRQGPHCCKLSQRQISEVSTSLVMFCGKIPSEFARQPRTLFELERWKATEFRQFLLYTGPVVFKRILSREMYTHFLSLTVAISILLESDNQKRSAYLTYAEDLLKYFVDRSAELYSEKFVVYNIHSLIHIADDARNFQCSLNEISAFPCENHLQTIKRMVRNAKNPIVQVTKRIKEKEFTEISSVKKPGTFAYISTKEKNNCFLLNNESYAFVQEKREYGRFVCDIVDQRWTEIFFVQPCESKLINIAFLKSRRHMKRRLVEKPSLYKKVVCLPFEDGHVLIPMLHGLEI